MIVSKFLIRTETDESSKTLFTSIHLLTGQLSLYKETEKIYNGLTTRLIGTVKCVGGLHTLKDDKMFQL